MNTKNPFYNFLPIFGAIFLILGLILGKFLYQNGNSTSLYFSNNSSGKVDEVIEKVVKNYVDPIDENEITEYTITHLLNHLDPHSTYIPPQEVKTEKERMSGKFEGIGIEFRIIEDTLMVINSIHGGPSERAGVLPGDRIIGLNNESIALGKLTTDSLVTLLRGKKGSEINLMIFRPFDNGHINIPVIRSEIPIFSIDAAFLLSDSIGYIKINRFSYQTHAEFKKAAKTIIKKGAKKIILDVRNNPGGSLNAVVNICEELLPEGRNIVYTKGENEQESYNSRYDGDFSSIPLAVLINQNSASASEILAGALQDNDRATIFGRRTFGKGLVQSVLNLKDHSRIHLTIARYYIPSGRCIQKPFEKDDIVGYRNDERYRWENGELYHKDSMKILDTTLYKTVKGRIVYGGGGVIPDEFVPLDTTMNSKLLYDITEKNLISSFAIQYFTPNKIKGIDFKDCTLSLTKFSLEQSFKKYCVEKGIDWIESDWKTSKAYIMNRLKAYILRVKLGNNGLYQKIAEDDSDIQRALNFLSFTN